MKEFRTVKDDQRYKFALTRRDELRKQRDELEAQIHEIEHPSQNNVLEMARQRLAGVEREARKNGLDLGEAKRELKVLEAAAKLAEDEREALKEEIGFEIRAEVMPVYLDQVRKCLAALVEFGVAVCKEQALRKSFEEATFSKWEGTVPKVQFMKDPFAFRGVENTSEFSQFMDHLKHLNLLAPEELESIRCDAMKRMGDALSVK